MKIKPNGVPLHLVMRPIILTMKISIFFFSIICFGFKIDTGFSQNTKIVFNENIELQVEEVFEVVKKQTKYTFIYKSDLFENAEKIALKKGTITLKRLLEKCKAVTNVDFDFSEGGMIIFREKPKITEDKQEQITITGTIIDGNGDPLPGANIVVKGTTNGVQSDFDGNFSIEVIDENAILIISYIGFATKEVPVGDQTEINIVLEESAAGLEEVIVTGYTAQSRRLVTGAVETINVDELAKNPAVNVEQQLQGKISGVNIITSGNPSGSATVRIRGLGNLGTARAPLYIIDGAPASGLDDINPDDIETISVLKDGSAASVYGARAANGVVLVTTKKGKKGQQAKLTYNSYFGVDTDPGKLDVLNAQQWGEMEFRGQLAAVRGTPDEAGFVPSHPSYGTGLTPVIPEFINGDPSLPYNPVTNRLMRSADTDWYDAITRTAFVQNHSLSMQGGGESSRYSLSFGYLDREGTLIANSFQRYTTRLNTEFSFLNDKLRIGENITVAYSENNGNTNIGTSRQRYHPLIPRFDEGGNFGGTLGGILGLQTNATNPEANQIRSSSDIERRWRVFGNAYLEGDIIPDLTFRSSVAIDYTQNNNSAFNPSAPEQLDNNTSLIENSNFLTSLTWTNTLNYRKRLEDHSFDVLLGTEAIEIKSKNISFNGTDFFSENLDFVSISTSGATNSLTGIKSARNLASVFGKLDYSYKDRYLFNATVRRDGSSALGPNNRFDVFPSFGAGWVISDEKFLTDSSKINLLKLRAGWGAVGNQNSLGDFNFISNFSQDPTFRATGVDINAINGGDPANGIALLSRGNPNLVWETSETLNIGVDFTLFDYKVTGAIEWYDRRTKDLLLQTPVPLAAGSAEPAFSNFGEIQNKGWDVSLSYNNNIGDLEFGITGIVSTYKNEVLDIDGNPESFFQGPGGNPNIVAARTEVGGEIAAFYGLIVDGVIQEGDDAGNFNFQDMNNDGTIDFNDQDFIGSPHPDFTYSLNLTANYKNFDFTAFFRGSQGNDIWAYDRIFTDFQFREGINRSTRVLNAWSPDNPTNTLAEFNLNTATFNQQASSYYVEDGSYLRLQTAQLGYTFPDIGLGLDRLRVYLQGQNIFTITGYSGIDPEVGENGGLEIGVDRGATYTVPRTFLIGFNVSF